MKIKEFFDLNIRVKYGLAAYNFKSNVNINQEGAHIATLSLTHNI